MVVYVSCRAGHPRVASIAALPQFTFCPHPAVAAECTRLCAVGCGQPALRYGEINKFHSCLAKRCPKQKRST